MGKTTVIIVAAGKGLRMGAELPKQFLSLLSRPVLMHTIERFVEALPDAEIIVVLNSDYIAFWRELCDKHRFNIVHSIVEGGDTRFASVKNGVDVVSSDTEKVLIHDGVRPFVSKELILRVEDALNIYDAAIPAIDIVDSVREVISPVRSRVIERSSIRAVQTPQGVRSEVLRESYKADYRLEFTDDASVVEFSGFNIHIVKGEKNNMKITTSDDMEYAEFLLSNRSVL